MRRLNDLHLGLIKDELRRLLRMMDKMQNPQRDGDVPTDVWMSDEEIVVRFEVAGADTDSIQINGTRTLLEISGTRSPMKPPDGGHYVIAERLCGPFRKAVELPAPVDLCRVRAELEDGVMTVVIQRIADRRQTRHRVDFTLVK